MLTSEREKRICDKYSAVDGTGHVHCNECPLVKGNPRIYDFRCKANSHYDRSLNKWVEDDAEYEQQMQEEQSEMGVDK